MEDKNSKGNIHNSIQHQPQTTEAICDLLPLLTLATKCNRIILQLPSPQISHITDSWWKTKTSLCRLEQV